jgi:hypothetical protein
MVKSLMKPTKKVTVIPTGEYKALPAGGQFHRLMERVYVPKKGYRWKTIAIGTRSVYGVVGKLNKMTR